MWLLVVACCSTSVVSRAKTDGVVMRAAGWVAPNLAPAEADRIHTAVRALAHVLEYGTLTLLCFHVFRVRSSLRGAAIAFAIALACAVLDELHQAVVPGRTASLHDVVLDALGALVALAYLTVLAVTRFVVRAIRKSSSRARAVRDIS
jgi:VanZ family protein